MTNKRSLFNEATRVQMPALVHLTRIGYTYFGKISEDMSGSVFDPDTNILIRIFKEQFAKLNISAFIEHSYFEDVKNILAHGATQESVNNDDLLGLGMLVPTSEVLELFHAKAKPLYAQISRNICENQKLTEIRDWLLPMLMNGQATISD